MACAPPLGAVTFLAVGAAAAAGSAVAAAPDQERHPGVIVPGLGGAGRLAVRQPCGRPRATQVLVQPISPQEGSALATWHLDTDGLELLALPVQHAASLALRAGAEMTQIASNSMWRSIKNGDESRGRRQSYLRMRGQRVPRAPISSSAASVLEASQQLVRERLGEDMVLNDCVLIADFEPDLPRQELHRDINRDAVNATTHGLLVPLATGARLHVVLGSHVPRGGLRGSFQSSEVRVVDVPPGWALLWDGMLVHAGDSAAPGATPDVPNRPRLHGYAEHACEMRPYD
eukprot:CAMPEP_0180695842 /NCGR_PEP_ID=MMETSP1038_2-20121128/2663_1 /TAXON_ID=632150 /ORGANISM="Azadinium spinosum, Strain 3D9" /LENGTH=287 /DNA_ID=CAMNT_0022727285 /DNA_START=14 /DNA_END=875 /DNA_ORIENTATION=-